MKRADKKSNSINASNTSNTDLKNKKIDPVTHTVQKTKEQKVTKVVRHKTSLLHEVKKEVKEGAHKRAHNEPLANPQQTITIPKYEEVALVLQGGGALGSYQAGVYEGLLESGIEPTWLAGISIGALNTAIIAGNPPDKRVEKLKGFWDTICSPPKLPATEAIFGPWIKHLSGRGRAWLNSLESTRAMLEGQKGFFIPKFPLPFPLGKYNPDQVSYYNTNQLKETLLEFADFDLINNGKIRVSLGAVNIQTGNFAYFDNTKEKLRPEHFMASGALPPGFPAVEIDGQFYWDGGLISNTPLTEVLKDNRRKDTLIFQVDLWSAHGRLPASFNDVQERTKDIQFSSRTRMVTDTMAEHHENARIMKELLAHIPEHIRSSDIWCKKATELAKEGVVNVIQLIYKNKEYEGHNKDYEFSPITMCEHWNSGRDDVRNTLTHPEWLNFPDADTGFVTHDVHEKR